MYHFFLWIEYAQEREWIIRLYVIEWTQQKQNNWIWAPQRTTKCGFFFISRINVCWTRLKFIFFSDLRNKYKIGAHVAATTQMGTIHTIPAKQTN